MQCNFLIPDTDNAYADSPETWSNELILTSQQHAALLAALRARKEAVVVERKRDADDHSKKWNDARESRARSLDKERDDLDAIIHEVSKTVGSVEW